MKKKNDYSAPETFVIMAVSAALICASPIGIEGDRDDYDTSEDEIYL